MSARAVGRVRHPAAANAFYPSDPGDLASLVERLLSQASRIEVTSPPTALIVPHAGYPYSGPVAATGYATLRSFAGSLRRVVLLGPAHFVALEGVAGSTADWWRTPLGDVSVDEELRAAAVAAGAVLDEGPHEPEHAIEVQLPFLQFIFGSSLSILPLAVGIAAPTEVAALIESLPGDALVIVSTDLSHYRDVETARRLDRRTVEEAVARNAAAIHPDDACGAFALRGLIEHARRRDLEVRPLDVRTSADTAGDPSRVVGYASLAVG